MLVWVKEVLRDVLHSFIKGGTDRIALHRETVSIKDSELLNRPISHSFLSSLFCSLINNSGINKIG